MVSANKEMVVYCFDTLVAHYNSEQPPPPSFDDGQQYASFLSLHIYISLSLYVKTHMDPKKLGRWNCQNSADWFAWLDCLLKVSIFKDCLNISLQRMIFLVCLSLLYITA